MNNKRENTISNALFHDEITLAQYAEALGEQAMKLGLIPSFVVHHFPAILQFYIPDRNESQPLTLEEAYLQLQQLLHSVDPF